MVKAENDETPRRLLAAARTVVAERGWAAATTRAIAAEAGVNLALVNYHFGLKRKLLEAMVEQVVERLQTASGPVPEDLGAMLAEWIPNVQRLARVPDAQALLEAIFAAIHDPELAPVMHGQLERLRAALAGPVRAAGYRGRRARGLTQALAALLDGLMLHHAVGAEVDARAVADALVHLVRGAST